MHAYALVGRGPHPSHRAGTSHSQDCLLPTPPQSALPPTHPEADGVVKIHIDETRSMKI